MAILAVGTGDMPLLVRSAGRQRLGTIRRLRTVGAAPRGAARTEWSRELGGRASGAFSAFLGANFMLLLPRWLLGSGDEGASIVFR